MEQDFTAVATSLVGGSKPDYAAVRERIVQQVSHDMTPELARGFRYALVAGTRDYGNATVMQNVTAFWA